MKFVSLFSGIGGIDLGLERAGMECVAQVENDPWCNQILEKHWPDTPRWQDIHDLDPKELPDHDLIAGGFPCQPVSLAGARLAQDDPRWLWPEFFRIVRMVRPRYVLVENVPGLASAGMGDVLGDLASSGYDCEWQGIPAAFVGAPHLRWRIFIIAYPSGSGRGTRIADVSRQSQPHVVGGSPNAAHANGESEPGSTVDAGPRSGQLVLANTDSGSRQVSASSRNSTTESGGGTATVGGEDRFVAATRPTHHLANTSDTDGRQNSEREATIEGHVIFGGSPSRIATGDDWWTVEPDVGRVADGIPRRVDRLKGLGNAVVPQVAELIGRMILEADRVA